MRFGLIASRPAFVGSYSPMSKYASATVVSGCSAKYAGAVSVTSPAIRLWQSRTWPSTLLLSCTARSRWR